MKNFITSALLLILTAIGVCHAQIPVVNTLADLVARPPSPAQPLVQVLGKGTPGDWGAPKPWYYNLGDSGATNHIKLATKNGIGRWVYYWDGDARVFGAFGDGVTVCNTAISNAWKIDGRIYLPKGNYLIDCAHTLNDVGNPVGLFFNPPTDLANRLTSVRLEGDGMGRTIFLMTNYGTGFQIGGAVYSTNLGPSLYNVAINDINIEGDRTNVQTALAINHATFNSRIENLKLRGVKTGDSNAAISLNECWNLHTSHLSIWGDFVTRNGIFITNANQMHFDYFFTQTFSSEGTNGTGFFATNPDGLKITNFQIANKSAYGIRLQATGSAGNDGPTYLFGNSEGPMVFLKTERHPDADPAQYIDHLDVNISGFTGGPNGTPVGLPWMTNNFRHCLWFEYARNVEVRSSQYTTRNEDFTMLGGGINTNYCIKIEPTCRNVRIGHSRYDHTSTLLWVKDEQLRPNAQPDSHMMIDRHVVGTNYLGSVGVSGAMAVQTVDAYPYYREATQWEILRTPRAVELQIEGTITAISTNPATLGVLDSGCLNVWAATPWIWTNNPSVRRWVSFPMNPYVAVGTVVRGTIMTPVSAEGQWVWQANGPTNWSSTWKLTPIGIVY